MSGGGATHGGASTDMVAHLKDSHSLMMLGLDSAGSSWLDSGELNLDNDYVDAPSVLRYIYEKGITDAGGNPFDGVSAYDPEDDLEEMQEELDDFITSVGTVDPDSDVESWLATADAAAAGDLDTLDVDSAISTIIASARINASQVVAEAVASAGTSGYDQVIERARAGFEARAKRDHLNSISQFTGPMADVNAVNTSAFVIGMAKLERDLADRLAQFETEFILPINREGITAFIEAFRVVAQQHLAVKAQVHLAQQQNKANYILNATNLIATQLRAKLQAEQSLVELQKSVSSAKIVAGVDEEQQNLDVDVKGQQWDLELFQQGANILSAVSGSVVPTAARPSRISSGLSGALGGASAMDAAASIIPGVGTAVGAGVGGAVGLVAGLLE